MSEKEFEFTIPGFVPLWVVAVVMTVICAALNTGGAIRRWLRP